MKIDRNYRRISDDVVIEYIKSDENINSLNYSILTNNIYGDKIFVNSLTMDSTITLHNFDRSEYKKPLPIFVSKRDYDISNPTGYDKIKVWVKNPESVSKFLITAKVIDGDGNRVLLCSSLFNGELSELTINSEDLIFLSDRWSLSYDILIPSPEFLSNEIELNGEIISGSINDTLTDGVGIIQNTLLFIDFISITGESGSGEELVYNTQSPIQISFTSPNKFKSLSLNITENINWITIEPNYNGSNGGFIRWVRSKINSGWRPDIRYNITQTEGGVKTQMSITVGNELESTIELRPVLKFTNTIAIIDVEMVMTDRVSLVNESIVSTIVLMGDSINKFSKKILKIDVGSMSPINVEKREISKRLKDFRGSSELVLRPRDYSLHSKFYQLGISGELELDITDNVVVFKTGLQLSNPVLVFKWLDKTIEIKPYLESSLNNFNEGVIVFLISSEIVRKLENQSLNVFYLTDRGQLVYSGNFLINQSLPIVNSLLIQKLNNPVDISIESDKILEDDLAVDVLEKSVTLDPSERILEGNDIEMSDVKLFWVAHIDILRRSFWNTNGWVKPVDMRKFAIDLKISGMISESPVDPVTGEFTNTFKIELGIIQSYLKTLDFNPTDRELLFFLSNFREDFIEFKKKYPLIRESGVMRGSSKPSKPVLEFLENS